MVSITASFGKILGFKGMSLRKSQRFSLKRNPTFQELSEADKQRNRGISKERTEEDELIQISRDKFQALHSIHWGIECYHARHQTSVWD